MTLQGRVLIKQLTGCWHKMFTEQNLLVTNTVSGGILLAVGDTVQQTREIRKDPEKSRDWQRTGRMFVIGACLSPVDHYWYIWLDRALPSASMRTVVKKVLIEQILASPIVNALFFLGIGSLEGQTLNGSLNEFRSKFWEMYK
ncbi:PREDICTED: mpv17-like protein 2, partial [Nanorana parkeri]|uniref:mpv17-like protein 2 n=1 Tax=Nanorana parkeri TaxID=125878 RepID=UPI000854F478